ncbi:hypothetical protein R75461_07269 [Paraburkholderia nemoris]|nr:hypothetical protein R75461_07269 [Paraburkholderia nemoris]
MLPDIRHGSPRTTGGHFRSESCEIPTVTACCDLSTFGDGFTRAKRTAITGRYCIVTRLGEIAIRRPVFQTGHERRRRLRLRAVTDLHGAVTPDYFLSCMANTGQCEKPAGTGKTFKQPTEPESDDEIDARRAGPEHLGEAARHRIGCSGITLRRLVLLSIFRTIVIPLLPA